MALYAKAVVLLFMLVVVKDVHSALRGKNSKSTLLKAGRKGGYGGGGGGGENSYNMHAPYVEEKSPGEMLHIIRKLLGKVRKQHCLIHFMATRCKVVFRQKHCYQMNL